METFWSDLMAQVYPLAAAALVIIAGALVQKLRVWVEGKTQNESALLAMDHFQNIVDSVVDQIAEDVKKEGGPTDDTPGVITREEAILIKNRAMTLLQGQIPPALKEVLESLIGDLDQWLNGMIVNSIRVSNIQYRK